MLNVAYQSQYTPYSWGLYHGLWERYFGDMNKPEDVVQMHQKSQINLVDKMQAAASIVAENATALSVLNKPKDSSPKPRLWVKISHPDL